MEVAIGLIILAVVAALLYNYWQIILSVGIIGGTIGAIVYFLIQSHNKEVIRKKQEKEEAEAQKNEKQRKRRPG